MKNSLVLFVLTVLVACAPVPKDPEKFGVVQVVLINQKIDDKTGEVTIIKQVVEEKAERSVADKGAESLVAPQRVTSFTNYFSSYHVGKTNELLVSAFNQSDGTGGSDLWIVSNSRMRLTNTNYDHLSPSFSTDGRYVYFSSYRGKHRLNQFSQDSYIWRTARGGAGGITRIGSPAFAYNDVSESPDGQRLLFSSIELYGNAPYIWHMSSNGALPTQLKQGHTPQWIDNETIIFTAVDESSGLEAIWTSKIDGSFLTQLIADNNFNCKNPQPSPDGSHIAYVKEDPRKDGVHRMESRDIYVYTVSDGLSQQITTNESRDDLPRWSEDGQYLYFRSSRGLGWSVWRVDFKRLMI